MKILVCGSRSWTDRVTMNEALSKLPRSTQIICGGAKGADMMAIEIARNLMMQVEIVLPEYDKFPARIAPLKRNIKMLGMKPDAVWAFWDGVSKGTKHTITEALKRHLSVYVWDQVDRHRMT